MPLDIIIPHIKCMMFCPLILITFLLLAHELQRCIIFYGNDFSPCISPLGRYIVGLRFGPYLEGPSYLGLPHYGIFRIFSCDSYSGIAYPWMWRC